MPDRHHFLRSEDCHNTPRKLSSRLLSKLRQRFRQWLLPDGREDRLMFPSLSLYPWWTWSVLPRSTRLWSVGTGTSCLQNHRLWWWTGTRIYFLEWHTGRFGPVGSYRCFSHRTWCRELLENNAGYDPDRFRKLPCWWLPHHYRQSTRFRLSYR